MTCAACGVLVEESARFCPRCGEAVRPGAGGDSPPASRPGVVAANVSDGRLETIVTVRHARNPGLAAVLSFFWCGLGQIYNGEIGKGIVFVLLYTVSLLLLFVLVGFVTTPLLWIWGVVDAYQTAERLCAGTGVGEGR